MLFLLSGYLVDGIRSGSFLRHAGLIQLQLLISRRGISADTRVENRARATAKEGEKVEILTREEGKVLEDRPRHGSQGHGAEIFEM